jgi:agmatine/peptidylarginine deiminase
MLYLGPLKAYGHKIMILAKKINSLVKKSRQGNFVQNNIRIQQIRAKRIWQYDSGPTFLLTSYAERLNAVQMKFLLP